MNYSGNQLSSLYPIVTYLKSMPNIRTFAVHHQYNIIGGQCLPYHGTTLPSQPYQLVTSTNGKPTVNRRIRGWKNIIMMWLFKFSERFFLWQQNDNCSSSSSRNQERYESLQLFFPSISEAVFPSIPVTCHHLPHLAWYSFNFQWEKMMMVMYVSQFSFRVEKPIRSSVGSREGLWLSANFKSFGEKWLLKNE